MKTIGLIGGMSWESTVTYYQIINEKIKEKLGGLHSAKILMYSVDFDEIESRMSVGKWDENAEILTDAAKRLEAAGADFILICTNTLHKVLPIIEKRVNVPFLHIADATADELIRKNIKKTAFLGTKYTMTQDFNISRIENRGIEVLIPDENEIETVNRVIFEELCLGIVSEKSRAEYSHIIANLKEKGAEAVVLGCTEIGMLIRPEDSVLPTFDTTIIHATAAAEKSLICE